MVDHDQSESSGSITEIVDIIFNSIFKFDLPKLLFHLWVLK